MRTDHFYVGSTGGRPYGETVSELKELKSSRDLNIHIIIGERYISIAPQDAMAIYQINFAALAKCHAV